MACSLPTLAKAFCEPSVASCVGEFRRGHVQWPKITSTWFPKKWFPVKSCESQIH
jgi:hypothetical protein